MDIFWSFFCFPHCLRTVCSLCLDSHSSLIYQEDSCPLMWLSRNISSSQQSCLPTPISTPPTPCIVPRQRCLGTPSSGSYWLSPGHIPLLGNDWIARQSSRVAQKVPKMCVICVSGRIAWEAREPGKLGHMLVPLLKSLSWGLSFLISEKGLIIVFP